MRRIVTLHASRVGVFARQWPAGPPVIELLHGRLPLNDRKILSVMLRMTTYASLAAGVLLHNTRVETTSCIEARCDLRVTLQALKHRLAAKLMAGCAVHRAGKGSVRLGERSG